MSAPVIWRALQPCMVAGVYREAGEVFEAPDGEYDPAVRVKIGEQDAASGVTHEGKPFAKMNVAELEVEAARLGVVFPPNIKTNKDKVAYLEAELEAAKAPGVTPDDLPDV